MEEKTSEPQVAEKQELGNEHVRFAIHRKPQCKVEFEVTITGPLLKEAHKKAVKAVGKEVTIPGFRKGKGPENLVIKNYPPQIDKEWQNCIADAAFKECDKIAKVPRLTKETSINYQMKSHSMDEAKLTFSFETEPEIPTVDPKTFQKKEIERPDSGEQKVEETIRQVQLFFAQWNQVTDRPVQEGDFIRLDVDVIEEQPEKRLFSDTRFEVVDKSMAKWMKDLVIGQPVGASIEGVSIPDEDAKEEDKETLKPKKVRVTIKMIEEAKIPPVDEAFAKQLGVESVEDMRTNIANLLNRQADAHVREALREQVSEFLLNQYVFDLPLTLVYREAQFRMKQLTQDPQFIKYWDSMNEQEHKNTTNSILKQAEKAVRMFYLCRKIISDANITVKPDDVQPPPSNFLEALLVPRHQNEHPQPEMHQAEMYSRLILEKAEDYIIDHAT